MIFSDYGKISVAKLMVRLSLTSIGYLPQKLTVQRLWFYSMTFVFA